MRPAILITGAAGFIGFHPGRRLLDEGATLLGVDNLASYHDPVLKRPRLGLLRRNPWFQVRELAPLQQLIVEDFSCASP